MLLLLLSWGSGKQPDDEQEFVSVVNLEATEIPEEAPEASSPEREPAKERPAPKTPQPPEPTQPQPPQAAEPKAPPPILPPIERLPAPVSPPAPTRPSTGKVYGPPDTGGSSASRDTERVGTAPNGEPLYAAAWYREPSDGELRGYLSTASGPGWGLIACRTAPDYRVEDCVGLDEYPSGSQINRAVLAAAWQFKVRPPRLGGRPIVGGWVRIRIDYGIGRR
ncbi:hypothetical protein [Sphingopyxis fribergensis]